MLSEYSEFLDNPAFHRLLWMHKSIYSLCCWYWKIWWNLCSPDILKLMMQYESFEEIYSKSLQFRGCIAAWACASCSSCCQKWDVYSGMRTYSNAGNSRLRCLSSIYRRWQLEPGCLTYWNYSIQLNSYCLMYWLHFIPCFILHWRGQLHARRVMSVWYRCSK